MNSATLFRSFAACAVTLTLAAAPGLSSGWTLLGRLVQICPPRRLGSSLKFLLRASIGPRTALSRMNRRSKVLRAASRLIVLLIVTRTVAPDLRSRAMSLSPKSKGSIADRPPLASLVTKGHGEHDEQQ